MQKWLWNQEVVGGWKNIQEHDRKVLDCLEQTLSRNMDIKDAASGGTVGSEEYIIENQKN